MTTAAVSDESQLLNAAAAGDHAAFRRLVEDHRRSLHAHCYRMLASPHDADDAVQDALLRAWRGVRGFEGRSTVKTWLHRIATNVCLDEIAKRSKRVLPFDYGPPGDAGGEGAAPLEESLWIEPYPDRELGAETDRTPPEARYEQREALELAFVAALQHLPARQRAALILRDVLGFSAREVAEALDISVDAANSGLARARKAVEARLPPQSQQATLRLLGDRAVRELVERFVDAFERGDVETIVSMLTDEALFSMPPYAGWCQGRRAVEDSWLMPGGPPPRLRYRVTTANGQVALGTYAINADARDYLPIALDVVRFEGARVAEVVAFRLPSIFVRFGLPPSLGGQD